MWLGKAPSRLPQITRSAGLEKEANTTGLLSFPERFGFGFIQFMRSDLFPESWGYPQSSSVDGFFH